VLCLICRSTGIFEIYLLPDFTLVFTCTRFHTGATLYADTDMPLTTLDDPPPVKTLQVTDVCMRAFATDPLHPCLIVTLNNGEFYIYRSFSYPEHCATGHLPIRFTRVPTGYSAQSIKPVATSTLAKPQDPSTPVLHPSVLEVNNVNGRGAFFITGSNPGWVISDRGLPRFHPLKVDGPIHHLAPFNNINCPNGVIYLTTKEVLRICQLPPLVIFEHPWPIRKLPLKCTPRHLTYVSEVQSYALLVSFPAPQSMLDEVYEPEEGEPPPPPPEPPIPRCPRSPEEAYELRILTPALDWQLIDKHMFERHEHALCIKAVTIKGVDEAGPRQMLAVGTGYMQGEDSSCRGRIMMFEVFKPITIIEDSTMEPQATPNKLRLLFQREHKGPVSAVAQLESNYVLVAIGQRIIVHSWRNSDLVGTAFYDVDLYVTSISIVKNFVLYADLYKGGRFLRWKDDNKSMTPLAKDFEQMQVYATEFIIDQSSLQLLTSDANKNITILSYSPLNVESRGGQKLLRHGQFHVGSNINKFLRLRMQNLPKGIASQSSKTNTRHACFYGTLDGGLGVVSPVSEVVYRRMLTLQSRMNTHLPHYAGLNPAAFRQIRPSSRANSINTKNVLDGTLLSLFLSADTKEQKTLARMIGSTQQQIINDLLEMQYCTNLF